MNTIQTRFIDPPKPKKEKPIPLVPATSNQIRQAAMRNLSNLKLSKLSTGQVKFIAQTLAAKGIDRRNIKAPVWGKVTKSKRRNGREIVTSYSLPERFWAERRIARKYNWDTK